MPLTRPIRLGQVLAERRVLAAGLCGGLLFAAVAGAQAATIDLGLFFVDPGAPVAITADGSSATLSEDAAIAAVILSNVPGAGDPELIVATPGVRLQFDYSFDEPVGNADVFHASLLDGTSGATLGPAFELLLTDSGSGQFSVDLSSLVGTTLGLQFELVPEFADASFDSSVTISNLQLVAVPLPPALVLMVSGLGCALAPAIGRKNAARERHAS